MAVLESNPTQVNPTLFYNRTGDEAEPFSFRVTPKDYSGNLLDLTGYNTADIQYVPFSSPANVTPSNVSVGISNADATGADINVTQANANNLFAGLLGLPASLTVVIGDGTDLLIAARGQMQITLLP